ncbi:MAG: GerMN domain-containing protein [Treponematales bacterium]
MFWITFFVVMTALFMVNGEKIRETVRNTFLGADAARPAGPVPLTGSVDPSFWDLPAELPEEEEAPPPDEAAGKEVAAKTGQGEKTPAAPPAPSPALRERAVYFIQRDSEGVLPRVKVVRKLPGSNSPLLDSLNALIAGPSADESGKGLVSLIPEGTKILNAAVRGGTAYINLSEDFQFNTYGVQGYEGGLEQLVWTATEFPTVADVQVLIEGRIVDFLGESVRIGIPRSRGSF